jgi:N4-gp56 family major capsid protein
VKQWASDALLETISRVSFGDLMSTDPESYVYVAQDLRKGRGDQIKYDLVSKLGGDGTVGDAILVDNTEGLSFNQDSVGIEQLRHAVEARTMSQQRTVHDLRAVGRNMIALWFSEIMEIMFGAHLAGTAGLGNTNATRASAKDGFGGNSYTAPDSAHEYDKTGLGTKTSELADFDYLIEKAQMSSPVINPVMVDGRPYYIYFMHPYAWTSLRRESASGGYLDVLKNAEVRGSENPILSGAELVHNNIIVRVMKYLPYDTTNSVCYNVLAGQQAMCVAFGNAYDELDQETYGKDNLFSWVEDRLDAGNRKIVGGGAIFGMKKARFNSTDYATIRVKTKDIAHA